MTPEIITQLNDYRSRIVQAYDLRDAGEDVPEGLMPSEEEMRGALRSLREARSAAGKAPARKGKAKSKIAAEGFDLMSLFDNVPDKKE